MSPSYAARSVAGTATGVLKAGLRGRTRAVFPVVLGFAAVGVGWTWLSSILPPDILPGPWAVGVRALRMLTEPYLSATLLGHIGISLFRVLAGFAIGGLVGIALALAMYLSPRLRGGIDFVLAILLPLPPFTLIAVFIIWFGLGEAAKIALIVFGVFGRMAIYAHAAFRALPSTLEDAARTLGASGARLFFCVRIPAALPDLFVGMRILLALAWTSVMGAELIAANEGIGWAIWAAARNLQTDVIFVGVLAIALMGCLMDYLLVAIADRVTHGWSARLRGA